MRRTDVLVIGGGQAGLAISRCLADRGVDHAILERGRVAERWRSERWASLRLLTPSWQSRLPGWRYAGPDPDGYMTMPEVTDYLVGYARSFGAPVHDGTTVEVVEPYGEGYRVRTDRGTWRARAVVIATGMCDVPQVPAAAGRLDPRIHQLVPTRYRSPASVGPGGVLIVGASSTGIQLADELRRAGRAVTLAVGRHIRLPRTYRGRDILWWLDRTGVLDQRIDEVRDPAASRRQPSLQLVGQPDRASLDLAILQARGVRLVGRVAGIDGATVALADDLARTTAAADARLDRVLGGIDARIAADGLDAPPAERPAPVVPAPAPDRLDLRAERIETVIWATGFRREYPWLRVPVLDDRGELRHDGGVTAAPGLYALGLFFQRRRKSSFLDGVGDDARELAAHLHQFLCGRPRAAA